MKFSYSLLKKLVPTIPAKEKFVKDFEPKAFEIEEIVGDMIDIKLTANRWTDAGSHLGMAKEIAAVYGMKRPEISGVKISKGKNNPKIKLTKDSGCSRYIGVRISLSRQGKTPEDIKKVLITCGERPISPIVDILNYVMLEIGQPMHAFDASKVEGGITVRKAKAGERLITIDNRELDFSDYQPIVISDDKKSLALAGVKGGKESEITSDTKEIILESATFNPVSIYKTSRKFNLSTSASQRYVHSMSPETAELAAKRAVELIQKVCGGKVVGVTDVYPTKIKARILNFDLERFAKLTGVAISLKEALKILSNLGFKMLGGNKVQPPLNRPDIEGFEDLVEEVIRIYGLDKVPSVAPKIPFTPLNDAVVIPMKADFKKELSLLGFNEIYSYSFTGDNTGIEILNPISSDYRFMRSSVFTNVQKAIDLNLKNYESFKLFEIGKVFPKLGEEYWNLGIAVYDRNRKDAFSDLKSSIKELFYRLGIIGEIKFVEVKSNELKITLSGKNIGSLHISERGDSGNAEIENIESLYAKKIRQKFSEISSFPSISRDLSFWIKKDGHSGDILEKIESLNVKFLDSVRLIDRFEKNGQTSITFSLTFQSKERTLSDIEVGAEIDRLVAAFGDLSSIVLR